MKERKSSTSAKTRPDGRPAEDLGFEDALGRLGQAVEALETGDLGLDEALGRYEEGVRLLARCRTLLEGAERRVALLTEVQDDGTPMTQPYDARATPERAADPKPTFPANIEAAGDVDNEGDDGAPF